ncbi:ferrochelatase-2 [Hibiscus syriacus]|uniref:Ferrochelatase-2 n=1 Tax=Hibiscus syriacus TaxID=106335 RepID=A0A6A3CES5_HIBSY|nr:ferrochelatase-2 [Hibiscus syriacus]
MGYLQLGNLYLVKRLMTSVVSSSFIRKSFIDSSMKTARHCAFHGIDLFRFLEKSIRKLDFTPNGINTIVQVNDLKNSPGPDKKELRQATNQALNLLQDNYPEFVAKQVFIDVPWLYLAFNRMISPFDSENQEQVCEQEFTVVDVVTEVTIKPATKHTIEFPITEGLEEFQTRNDVKVVTNGEVSFPLRVKIITQSRNFGTGSSSKYSSNCTLDGTTGIEPCESKFVAIIEVRVAIYSKFVAIVEVRVAIYSKFVAIVEVRVAIYSKFVAIVEVRVAIYSKFVAIVEVHVAIYFKFVAIVQNHNDHETRRDGGGGARESPCSLSLNKEVGKPSLKYHSQ